MQKYAVIVAGGQGLRMGSAAPKQFLELAGNPLLWHTLHAFLIAYEDLQVILVLPEKYVETGSEIVATMPERPRIKITTGGDTRFHSVKNGLQLVKDSSVVFIHDAVRCLVTTDLIHRCYDTAIKKGNAIPAIRATDSIRIARGEDNESVERNNIRIIQTPQTFQSEMLLPAFDQEFDPAFTDEATVVEKKGHKIYLVEGETNNIKITHPTDLLLAERILKEREQMSK